MLSSPILQTGQLLVMLLAVAMVPGALVLALFDARRHLSPVLLAPAALGVSCAIAAAVTAAHLELHWSISRATDAMLVINLVLVVAVLVRDIAIRKERPLAAAGKLVTASCSWIMRMPIVVTLAAAAAAAGGLLWGNRFYADGDSYFHAALALKLQQLPHPTFDSLGAYRDGDSHPGYHIPVWHDLLAMAAHLANEQAIDVMRAAPALIAPLMVLAWAGLAHVVFRSRAAASLGAVAILAGRMAMTIPAPDGIVMGAEPRMVSGLVLLPLAWALALASASQLRGRDLIIRGERAHELVDWRVASGAGMLASVALVVMHISYGVWVFLGLAGFACALLAAGVRQPAARRQAVIAVGVAMGVVVVAIAALRPALSILLPSPQGQGALTADLGRIVIGDGWSQHLRADWLAQHGFVALLGIIAMVALCAYLRDPLVGFVSFTGALVLLITTVPPFAAALAHAVSLPQAARAYLALPWPVAIVGGGLLLGAMFDRWWKREAGRFATIMLAIALTLITAAAADVWHANTNRHNGAVIPPVIVSVITAALVVALIAGTIRARSRASATVHEPAHSWELTSVGFVLVAIILLAAPATAVRANQTKLTFLRETGPISDRPIPGISNRFDRATQRVLRSLRPGVVVLADPASSYRLMAIAPVYVAGMAAGHTADTRRNDRLRRAAMLTSFFQPSLGERARLKIIDDEHVDVVMVPATDTATIAFLRRHPDLFDLVSAGRKMHVYRVTRT